MKLMKEKSGITLVALVITIVILIILAVISITVVFGENGLIKRAEEAKNMTEEATRNEEQEISNAVAYMNEILGGTGGSEPERTLKEGDYVTYPSPNGDLACRVLYDSSLGYGVQLITSDTVTDSYELGDSDFTTAMNIYNNVISILNSAVSSYNNDAYSTVRCVGSVPNDPSQDSAGYFTSEYDYMSSYNGHLKDGDTNYETDYNQMEALGIRNIDKCYWLASRHVNSTDYSNGSNFFVRYMYSIGTSNDGLCNVLTNGNAYSYIRSQGLRPVFTLKSGIKVTGGEGTPESPYTLGL